MPVFGVTEAIVAVLGVTVNPTGYALWTVMPPVVTKRKHRFMGEDEGNGLVSWLNSGESDERKRIVEIVELYGKLGRSVPPPTAKKTGPGALSLRLWELLDRFTFKLDNRGFSTGLIPAPARASLDEHENVLRVQALRHMDLLSRVKRCDGCSSWMFCKVPGQRFCKESCRIRAYQSDPKWRARNNAKRRKLYQLHKQNENIGVRGRR